MTSSSPSTAPSADRRAAFRQSRRRPGAHPHAHHRAWRAEGPNTFILETRTPDSLVPFGLTWIGITHQAAWERAGRNWDRYLNMAVGTGPWKLESSPSASAAS